MKPHLLPWLFLVSLLALSSCKAIQPIPEPTVPAPFHIFLSSSASYWQAAISDCTRGIPQISVLVEQEPQDLVQVGSSDWVIQSGNPYYDLAFHLGEDNLVIIVNPTNPINRMDITQLKGIFTGFLTFWGEVNPEIPEDWKNKEIQAIHYLAREPITDQFEKNVLSGEVLSPKVWLAPGSAEIIGEVAKNQSAIGWVPSRWLTSTVKAISPFVIEHIPLTLSMQKEPDEFQKNLIGCMQSKAK